jgi:hypothetical protein
METVFAVSREVAEQEYLVGAAGHPNSRKAQKKPDKNYQSDLSSHAKIGKK